MGRTLEWLVQRAADLAADARLYGELEVEVEKLSGPDGRGRKIQRLIQGFLPRLRIPTDEYDSVAAEVFAVYERLRSAAGSAEEIALLDGVAGDIELIRTQFEDEEPNHTGNPP